MGPEREDRGGWDRREDGSRVRKVKGGGGENGESMDGEEMLGGWRRTSGTGSFISGWLNTGRHSPVSRETISPLPLSAASHPHHLPHFLFLNFSSSISLPHFLLLILPLSASHPHSHFSSRSTFLPPSFSSFYNPYFAPRLPF